LHDDLARLVRPHALAQHARGRVLVPAVRVRRHAPCDAAAQAARTAAPPRGMLQGPPRCRPRRSGAAGSR
jgi:hypothetical protein